MSPPLPLTPTQHRPWHQQIKHIPTFFYLFLSRLKVLIISLAKRYPFFLEMETKNNEISMYGLETFFSSSIISPYVVRIILVFNFKTISPFYYYVWRNLFYFILFPLKFQKLLNPDDIFQLGVFSSN